MKYGLLGLAVFALVVGGIVSVNRKDVPHDAAVEPGGKTAGAPAALDVDQFMQNVDHYAGAVRVAGVVSTVVSDQQILTLIDRREFEKCGVTTCAKLYLPVRWPGLMPEIGQIIRIEGETRNEDGKLVFVAHKLQSEIEPRSAGQP